MPDTPVGYALLVVVALFVAFLLFKATIGLRPRDPAVVDARRRIREAKRRARDAGDDATARARAWQDAAKIARDDLGRPRLAARFERLAARVPRARGGASVPFHLAFPVHDLEAARVFYVDVLGCTAGRSAERWIDFDFRGHQISAHLVDARESSPSETNVVDGDGVPVRHFGLVVPWDDWQRIADDLERRGTEFLIEPKMRFVGEPGEQATLFLLDPSGNAVELKSFRDPSKLFARS